MKSTFGAHAPMELNALMYLYSDFKYKSSIIIELKRKINKTIYQDSERGCYTKLEPLTQKSATLPSFTLMAPI